MPCVISQASDRNSAAAEAAMKRWHPVRTAASMWTLTAQGADDIDRIGIKG